MQYATSYAAPHKQPAPLAYSFSVQTTILVHTRKTPRRRSRQHGIAVFPKAGEVFGPRIHRLGKVLRSGNRRFVAQRFARLQSLALSAPSFARFWRRVGEASRCTPNWKRKARPLRPAHRSV